MLLLRGDGPSLRSFGFNLLTCWQILAPALPKFCKFRCLHEVHFCMLFCVTHKYRCAFKKLEFCLPTSTRPKVRTCSYFWQSALLSFSKLLSCDANIACVENCVYAVCSHFAISVLLAQYASISHIGMLHILVLVSTDVGQRRFCHLHFCVIKKRSFRPFFC